MHRGPKVEVVAADLGSIAETVEESGYIRAGDSHEIQAPSSGRIVEVGVSNGQMIKAGELILVMQDLYLEADLAEVNESVAAAQAEIKEARINLDTAYLNLDEANRNLARKKALMDASLTSKAEYETSLNEVKRMEQNITLLKSGIDSGQNRLAALQNEQASLSQQCEQLKVKSPIDGKVLALPVKAGQLVESGTLVAAVGAPGTMEAYAEILSIEAVKIQLGQTARVSFAGSHGQTFGGRVTEIYPQAQEKLSELGVIERRVPVVVTLEEKGHLQPGYEVEVSINCAARHGVVVIPREALVSGSNGENQVRVVRSGRVETRPVQTGLKNQLRVEIIQGLKAGDLVVRDGSLRIDDHKMVIPVKK